MPIEIRELVIKAVVSDVNQQNRTDGEGTGAASDEDQQSENFEDMVRQILEVIKENKNER